ncbi:hypothetical protein MNBD_GAMMA10-1912 [hydrothermal vent metagenome]|uniref:ADP-ribosylglycohydrolase n=1 Tax=hydrothermal vent metagenome TaxID=652676 RepID=A0A3B0XMU7_9ZZZZ
MSFEREDLYFPPIHDRIDGGGRDLSRWLIAYLNFREKDDTTQQQAKDYLDQIGQNSSLFAARFRGTLIGMALGDSLGATLDFNAQSSPLATTEVTENPLDLISGGWTGSTSMAICLAYSLIREKWFSKYDQMNLYMQWWKYDAFRINKKNREKTFGMSDTVIAALKRYESTGELDAGDPSPSATGSEALMRVAPAVLFYFGNVKGCIGSSGGISRATHKSEKAIASCKYLGALLFGAIRGYSKEELTEGLFEPYPGAWNEHALEAEVINIVKTAHLKTYNEIKSDGYITHTLEAAIWVFHNASSFEEGMMLVISLPGSHKNALASVYGKLAGAFYGEHNINPEWIKKTPAFHAFYYYADRLLRYGISDAPLLFLDENTHFMP